MARISGVVIPSEKQVQISLTYIYGIGPKYARDILAAAKIEPTTRVKDLTEAEEQKTGLPVRGQRTRTNARTRKGRAIAVGGTQPKAASKT